MSKSHDVSREASDTLSAVDEALRRSEDLHWSDPEFLAWEAGQTTSQLGELFEDYPDFPDPRIRYWAEPGPAHDRADQGDLGVEDAPMVTLRTGHPDSCLLCTPDPPSIGLGTMRMGVDDYPPREHTSTSGPLLLGPEPVMAPTGPCGVCDGTGEIGYLAQTCGDCGGTGTAPAHPEGQGVIR